MRRKRLAEALVLTMRADLMAALREHIKERGWTQSKAATELGITQPPCIGAGKRCLARFQCGYVATASCPSRVTTYIEVGGLTYGHGEGLSVCADPGFSVSYGYDGGTKSQAQSGYLDSSRPDEWSTVLCRNARSCPNASGSLEAWRND